MKLSDTTPEADAIVSGIYRRMAPGRKFALLQDAWNGARQFHAAGYRMRRPLADDREVFTNWLHVTLGLPAFPFPEIAVETSSELAQRVLDVMRALAALDIRCALRGSMASSIYGKPRFTQDGSLTAEPFPGQEQAFVQSLHSNYYVRLDAVQQAMRERRSFNVIHTSSGFKVDVFVRKETPFEISALDRRRLIKMGDAQVDLLAPEDVILFKLDWHRLGGGVSDRQWSDILGVLQVQKDNLDYAYLEHWANQLALTQALERARNESN